MLLHKMTVHEETEQKYLDRLQPGTVTVIAVNTSRLFYSFIVSIFYIFFFIVFHCETFCDVGSRKVSWIKFALKCDVDKIMTQSQRSKKSSGPLKVSKAQYKISVIVSTIRKINLCTKSKTTHSTAEWACWNVKYYIIGSLLLLLMSVFVYVCFCQAVL